MICKNCAAAADLQLAALTCGYPLDQPVDDLRDEPSAAAIVYPAIDSLHDRCAHRGCTCQRRASRVLVAG